MSKDKLISIGKDTLRYLLTALFAAVGVYIGIRVSMSEMQNNIANNAKDIHRIEMNDINWLKTKSDLYGNNIFYLQMNQSSLFNRFNLTMPYKFENTRGSN